jgi:formate C-acetyltransferase
MNDRIAAIRARLMKTSTVPDPEHQKLREESLAQTVGEPEVIREAKAMAHYFRNRALVINDGELVVGSSPWVKVGSEKIMPNRGIGRTSFSSPWEMPEDVEIFFKEGVIRAAGNHTTLDYGTILSVGFLGLIEQIKQRIDRLSPNDENYEEKRNFLKALKIIAEAYIDFCNRYADHAFVLSQECHDEIRKQELLTIAQNCRRVPAHPPNSFWEACQSIWSSFFFLPDAPGRVDQYLYPFYERDMEAGTLTRDFAVELLSCLWLKYYERNGPEDMVSARHHLTLGGVKPDGSDASNEITRLCLDVTEDLKLLRPQVGLRWNRNTSPGLLKRAVQALRSQTGHPDFCSDEQIVPALVNTGIGWEDARDFSLSGCNEVIITGKSQMGSVEGFINMPKILRLTLGLEPALGNIVNLAAIDSYEKLWDNLVDAMDRVASAAHQFSVDRDKRAADMTGGNLAASLVTKDCIENTLGYTQGGARYNNCNWDAIGIANLADALLAIRKLVFEEKALSLNEFVEIIRSNYEEDETLRRRILNQLPHFGNDDDEIDQVAAQTIEAIAKVLKRRTPFRGGEYTLGTLAGGENMQIEFGRKTGATFDGRKAGEPFADSLAASQGRDRNGVTAMLNSIAKLPHSLLPTSTTVNVKLDPKLLENEAGIEKIAALINGHFMSGGQQLQFNFYTKEMLLEARREPEKHANLMVRVAGYSAPFVSLWNDLQDEIISRTEHRL